MRAWRARFLIGPVLVVLLAMFLLSGCSVILLGMVGGGDDTLDLDGEQSYQVEVEVGERLTLEMRNPQSGGYEVTGACFHTELLNLELYRVVPGDPGEDDRLEYRFLAKAEGHAMIEIRMRPLESPEAPVEVYKRVLVAIEPD